MCLITQPPGKFEGETCVTLLAYEWTMNGVLDPCEEDEICRRASGPFTDADIQEALATYDTPLCSECRVELLAAREVHSWEDEQGFTYSRIRY